jgi:hypothetical protein
VVLAQAHAFSCMELEGTQRNIQPPSFSAALLCATPLSPNVRASCADLHSQRPAGTSNPPQAAFTAHLCT